MLRSLLDYTRIRKMRRKRVIEIIRKHKVWPVWFIGPSSIHLNKVLDRIIDEIENDDS